VAQLSLHRSAPRILPTFAVCARMLSAPAESTCYAPECASHRTTSLSLLLARPARAALAADGHDLCAGQPEAGLCLVNGVPDRALTDQLLFERMRGYANHGGWYAEETGPGGEAVGNFPQALTHLALISATYNLERTVDGRRSLSRFRASGQGRRSVVAEDPNVPFQVTPTDSAWRHHGEIGFGQIEHDVIPHGICTSVRDWAPNALSEPPARRPRHAVPGRGEVTLSMVPNRTSLASYK